MWSFEMMQDDKVVAKGEASVTMLYEFQKAFIESIGPGNHSSTGMMATLDELLIMDVNGVCGFTTRSVDCKWFGFRAKRIS